jgi:histidinol-phosphate aminotransferase
MAQMKGQEQEALYQALRQRKIYVRYFGTPELRDSLRITVGTPEDIKRLLQEIAAIQNGSVYPSPSGGGKL